MLEVNYRYALTGRYGKNLFNALRDSDFFSYGEALVNGYLEGSKVGGEVRPEFIEWLTNHLTYSSWDKYCQAAGVKHNVLETWLIKNELPDDEEELRSKYAQEYGADIAQHEFSDLSNADDIEVVYSFGLINRYADTPEGVRNKIEFLCRRARDKYDTVHPDISDRLRNYAERLGKEACEKLIKVSGFQCDIHGGRAEYNEPIPISEVLKCPSCGHPICPVCANAFSNDPKTIDDARGYIASCESVSGHAWCGYCGDYSVEFILRFLRVIGCPIPPECEDYKPIPREVKVVATATIDALPNKGEIVKTALSEFNKGITGIIKIPDATGEIWGVSDRYPDGWLLTLCRPEER